MPYGSKFTLVLPDGTPPEPAVFVTAVPNWSVGEELTVGSGEQFRILAKSSEVDEEMIEQGINGVFTVEPV